MSEVEVRDRDAEVEVALLLGHLLLFELDEPMRERLLEPELAAALLEVGLDVEPLRGASLDELASEYLETFLQPKSGGPLVQSLWTSGTYEGDAAVSVRKLAEAGGFELDAAAARGAAADHLGCLLLLWARARVEDPRISRRIEEQHLGWALPPLGRIAAGEGFYPGLARALQRFIEGCTDASERTPG